uniref:BolA protein n=1 Tax=Opuntia streptacantha TaxID=393608 RepID=A0A7C8ZIJ1_OPUST
MKVLIRPSTVYATAGAAVRHHGLLGQTKKAFFLHVCQLRNVSLCPAAKWVGIQKGELLRCFSSAGDSSSTHHHISEAGSIDSSLMQSMENKIRDELNAEFVTVKDAYGDGRHVSIDVISSAFEGQSAVNRQRMVYKAIWEELQTTVHAVDQMTTRTPNEAGIDK